VWEAGTPIYGWHRYESLDGNWGLSKERASEGAFEMAVTAPGGEGGPDAGHGVAGAPSIDTSTAHPARVYDYWLGGKDNFAADREAAEMALQAYPQLAEAVQSNRAFLARAVRYLTQEAGIR
jgi:hypothetical protein